MDYRSWLPDRRGGRTGRGPQPVRAAVRRGLIRLCIRMSTVPALRPVAEWGMRVVFNHVAPDWEKIRRDPLYRDAFDAALVQLPQRFPQLTRPPRTVLDVACGTGLAAAMLRERFPYSRVTGQDIAPEMVRRAQALVPGVDFVTCNSRALPFEDGAFELVVSVDGVYTESELARVTAPGGAILLVYTRGGLCPVARQLGAVATTLQAAGFVVQVDEGASWALWALKSA